jgi:hypothetical protein
MMDLPLGNAADVLELFEEAGRSAKSQTFTPQI